MAEPVWAGCSPRETSRATASAPTQPSRAAVCTATAVPGPSAAIQAWPPQPSQPSMLLQVARTRALALTAWLPCGMAHDPLWDSYGICFPRNKLCCPRTVPAPATAGPANSQPGTAGQQQLLSTHQDAAEQQAAFSSLWPGSYRQNQSCQACQRSFTAAAQCFTVACVRDCIGTAQYRHKLCIETRASYLACACRKCFMVALHNSKFPLSEHFSHFPVCTDCCQSGCIDFQGMCGVYVNVCSVLFVQDVSLPFDSCLCSHSSLPVLSLSQAFPCIPLGAIALSVRELDL